MHDAPGMGLSQGFHQTVHHIQGLLQGRGFRLGVLPKGLSCHVLHGDEADRPLLPLQLVDLVDDRDARVGEGGSGPGFAQESCMSLLIRLRFVPARLQSHRPVQPNVFREIDLSHPADSQSLEDAVASDGRADHRGSIIDPEG